jgi:hypothetical protein
MPQPGRTIMLADGREQRFVSRLDFRADTSAFDDAESCDLGILAQGVVIGLVSRLRWFGQQGKQSLRVAFRGEHTGEFVPMYVPKNKFHPQHNLHRVAAPVFDLAVTSLARNSDLVSRSVGEVAIAYVLPDRYPGLRRRDIPKIAEVLDVPNPSRRQSHFDHVESDGLYYMTAPSYKLPSEQSVITPPTSTI